MADVSNWTDAAEQWIAWARTPDHDAFWAYRSAFVEYVGPGAGTAVEIGAGEGRISRELGKLGWKVTLVEPVTSLLEASRQAHSAENYVQASANATGLEGGHFDLVVLYNVLMDVDDLEGTIAEAVRVLRPEGRLIVGIVHPIEDVLTYLESHNDGLGYFSAHPVDVLSESNGLAMRFTGWRRPLSAYVNASAAAGLAMKNMLEPVPDPSHPVTNRLTRGQDCPIFLWMEFKKVR